MAKISIYIFNDKWHLLQMSNHIIDNILLYIQNLCGEMDCDRSLENRYLISCVYFFVSCAGFTAFVECCL